MLKVYSRLLFFQYSLFLTLVIMLCWFSRLATDDYYFIWDVREHGIIQSVYSQYMEWCGRYAATFLMDIVYLLDVDQTWYFLYPLLSFIFLFWGAYLLIRKLFFHFNIPITPVHCSLLTFSFTAALFFSSADIGETWFWYCSLSSYLLSVAFFIWGSAFLLMKNKSSLFASMLCFIYVGGSSEIYSCIYGMGILILLVFLYRKHRTHPLFKRMLIVMISFGIAFILMFIAPGNFLRDGLFPKHEFLNSFLIAGKSAAKFGIVFFPFRSIYILAFLPVFAVYGNRIQTRSPRSFRSFFIKASLIFIFLLASFFYLVAFVMVETGPPRLWFLVSLLCTVYFSCLAFYAGYSGYLSDQKVRVLKITGLVLSFLILIYNLIAQYPVVSTYAKKHELRVQHLQDLNRMELETGTTISFPPLPKAGMLYSAEISSDTAHFTNKELRLGYDLKYYPVKGK